MQRPSPGRTPDPQVYYVYGFALLVLLILLIVAACVSVVGTYFLLNSGPPEPPCPTSLPAWRTGGPMLLFDGTCADDIKDTSFVSLCRGCRSCSIFTVLAT